MGKLIAHENRLTIDGDFLSLEDCFEAFRRSIEYADSHDIDDTSSSPTQLIRLSSRGQTAIVFS